MKGDHIHLQLHHLSSEVLNEDYQNGKSFGWDITKDPVPVLLLFIIMRIPTNYGEVIKNEKREMGFTQVKRLV